MPTGLGLAALVVVATAGAGEKERYDPSSATVGASLFSVYCRSCHGPEGRGDGPLADRLRYRPPDLTRLASRGEEFPFEQVRRVVDGRNPLTGHGGPDMPVWGDVFKRVEEGYDEKRVQERIHRIVHFLASIQQVAAASR